MKILALDTTSTLASVATVIYDENMKKISASYTEDINKITHSEKLLPLIDRNLSKLNIKISDIDKFVVTSGPGSFTGTRIGITTIKGFSILKDTPVYAFSSLEVLAYNCFKNTNDTSCYYVSLLNARNNRVYYGVYDFSNNNKNIILEASNDDINELVKYLKTLNNTFIFCGDCIDIFGRYLTEESSRFLIAKEDTEVRAEYVLDYFNFVDNLDSYLYNTYTLDVEYIRPSQAERLHSGNKDN